MATPGCVVCAKTLPRGRKGCDATRQSKFQAGTGAWVKEKDDTGALVPVYRGEKAVPGFNFTCDGEKMEMDASGLLITMDKKVRTTYDLIFGHAEHDELQALGQCVKQHTFKDATLPNGSPNPKPSVVDQKGEWKFLTYGDMKKRARAFGMCLRNQFGIGQKEKMSIWSGNSVEWMLADLSCACYNWTSVSVYDTLGPNAASYIVADSGSQVLVCEDKTFKLVPKLLEDEIYASNPGKDLKLVVFTGKGDADTKAKLEGKGLKVIGFEEAVNSCLPSIKDASGDTPPTKDNICTIMYTSGTTGMPKGVMLLHSNLTATVSTMVSTAACELTSSDVHLSYLPLAHIFERQNCMGLLSKGAMIYFASNGAKALLPDLSVVRPTIFAGVPKVYENVRDAVKRKMTGFKKTLFEKAMAAKVADLETGCGYSPLWDILVFSKTKQALGGRVRFCVTGGAPISKDTLQFVICALGPVIQGYGATETSAASTLTMSWDLNLGHVGPPLGNASVRLVDVREMNYFNAGADQYDEKAKKVIELGKAKVGGEVWIGGPGVSPGYYDPSVNGLKPGIPSNGMAKKTKEDFFQEDGWNWFMTGDIGAWTERGCLKIVDRRKNMFKTSLGEYVPVEEVEKVYQDTCGYVDFVFVPKETKVSYIAMCVVVSESIGTVMRWAKESGVAGEAAEVVGSEKFKKLLFDEFQAAAKAKKLQRFMYIAKPENIHIEFLPLGYQEEWVGGVQCANGHVEQLLTATFKARRSQLDQYFAPHFAKMYPDRPADHILP